MKKILAVTLVTAGCLWSPLCAWTAPVSKVPADKLSQLWQLHRKADGLIAENDFRSAIRCYLDILLLEPDDEAAYVNMGSCYQILGDFDRAKDAYQNALSINPDNEDAKRGLEKIRDPDGA